MMKFKRRTGNKIIICGGLIIISLGFDYFNFCSFSKALIIGFVCAAWMVLAMSINLMRAGIGADKLPSIQEKSNNHAIHP
jgi:hypothetical protein